MTDQYQGEEHRRFKRIPFDAPVVIEAPGMERLTCNLHDICLKGALVHTEHAKDLPVDTPFYLELPLGDSVQIRMEVIISHREGNSLGLLCLHIDLDSMTELKRLVELNLGDPALLNRELSALSPELV